MFGGSTIHFDGLHTVHGTSLDIFGIFQFGAPVEPVEAWAEPVPTLLRGDDFPPPKRHGFSMFFPTKSWDWTKKISGFTLW